MKRRLLPLAIAFACAALVAFAANYSASLYYAAGHGSACAGCHEMNAHVSGIHSSAHRNAACTECHEATLATKLRHLRVHLNGTAPESIRLRESDVQQMMANCKRCHQREYAAWHAGPHSATYTDIFLNTAHNTRRRLMDDCFRCHGMYYDGAVRDLVQPQDTRGPWHLTRPALAAQPTIPCQACHFLHSSGTPEHKSAQPASLAGPAVHNSVALFDRREQMHFSAAALAIPVLYDGPRPLKVSPDSRQAICYQCHAPRQPEAIGLAAANHWGPQAGSGDDRTPIGVHEGISCIACHTGHGESALASCASCHPQMSHCGIAVETMDTTYSNRASKHNIHWVKCTDCHDHGIPQIRKAYVTTPPNPTPAGQ